MKYSSIVSVIIPLNMKIKDLAGFLTRLSEIMESNYHYYEILLTDDSADSCNEKSISDLTGQIRYLRYLKLSRQYGREICIFAGLENAVGDYVVIMDAQTDPPSMIPDLVEHCRQSGGILTGISDVPVHKSWMSKLISGLFHAYMKKYLHVDYLENTTDFRVLSRQVVNAIIRIRDKRRHIKIFSAGLGTGQSYFHYTHVADTGSRASLIQNVKTGLDIIFANSKHPLRIASRLGIAVSLINLLYIVYILGIFFLKNQVAPGWTTTSMQMTVMFFFLFMILAVLCEYIGLILEESQDRPLYQLTKETNSSVLMEDTIRKNIIIPGE